TSWAPWSSSTPGLSGSPTKTSVVRYPSAAKARHSSRARTPRPPAWLYWSGPSKDTMTTSSVSGENIAAQCAKPATRGAGFDMHPVPHRSVACDHGRGPKPPILVTKEAKDRLGGGGLSPPRKRREKNTRTLRRRGAEDCQGG